MIDPNPNMTVAAAQRKHCHVYGVTTLYPVSASFQQREGYSNVIPLFTRNTNMISQMKEVFQPNTHR